LYPIKKIESDIFKNVLKYLNSVDNKKIIIDEVNEIFKPKEGYILTVKINDKWLNEYHEVINVLMSGNDKKYTTRGSFSSKEKESISENKYCYVCKQKKDKVYGYVNTFNFFTLDKKSFMTGGFNRKYAWKNYPVCPECSKTLESGKKFLAKNFDNKFAGFSYYVAPKFVFDVDDDDNFKVYSRIMKMISDDNEISLANDKKNYLLAKEDKILKKLSSEKNNITMDIVFYKDSNQEFKILKNIEDVLPSRLNVLFRAKDKIEKFDLFEPVVIKGKKEDFEVGYYFNFNTVREFFPNSKEEGSFDDYFLEVINSIFINKKIDEKFIVSNFIRKLQRDFLNEKTKDYVAIDLTKKSLLIYKYLKELDILNNSSGGEVKALIEKNMKNERYLNFFEDHGEVFNSDLKRGVFLLGVLVNRLLSLPEQSNKPFYSRLNSLKMDEKILKRVLVESINKFNEYGRNYYVELEELISSYLTLASFRELSNDELSYYFVTGMNLGRIFKNKKEEEEVVNE